MTNKDLVNTVNNIIKESGVTKTHIAKRLNIARQALDTILNKKSFSIDDANKVLKVIGYSIDSVSIKKI